MGGQVFDLQSSTGNQQITTAFCSGTVGGVAASVLAWVDSSLPSAFVGEVAFSNGNIGVGPEAMDAPIAGVYTSASGQTNSLTLNVPSPVCELFDKWRQRHCDRRSLVFEPASADIRP